MTATVTPSEGHLAGVALPEELRGPTPRPLPEWARCSPEEDALPLVLGAILVFGLVAAGVYAAAAFVAVVGGILSVLWIAEHRHTRWVLQYGVAVVAEVTAVARSRTELFARCRYATAIGPVEVPVLVLGKRAEKELGRWPRPGETLYLVHPPKAAFSPLLWGFGAAAAPTSPRSPRSSSASPRPG